MTSLIRAVVLVALTASLAACGGGPEKSFPTKMPSAPVATGSPAERWETLADLPWPQGGQTTYKTYEDSRRIFWKQIYPKGGTELYCAVTFDGARKNPLNQALSVEHVFPADAIAENEPGCTNRTCAAPRAQRAMADLQNLWPALQRVNSSRSNLRYGEIPGEDARRYGEFCPDYERGSGAKAIVEPRDDIKGDLARTIVYMHFVYGLPLEKAVADKGLLLDWMSMDPPDAEELRRNALIDRLQGTPNPLLQEAFMGL
ncbi:MAG: endonuclease [Alphaproteobacteria bacterium]|nr:endonuclease [Alphaproteobacteria bacterium]